MQYVLSLIAFGAAFLLAMYLGWIICRGRIWHETDFLYPLLHWMREYLMLVLGLGISIGWLVITYLFLRKPLRYLDEVVDAAERLASPDAEPIRLSNNMESIQDELNLVRERALRGAMEAREAERRKNDLLVYLAHDLKTPLTSVVGYLNLLRDEPDISPELRGRYTGIALDKALRLEDLINEFFEITRFNLSKLELETRCVDLTRMLEQVRAEFEPMLAEREMRCAMALPKTLKYVCDADKMARVFDNLLRNAWNYADPGTEIAVDGSESERGVELIFSNHGRTIPPEKLERIFDRFYRLDSARGTGTGGAGLGLAIAREIVEAHGGTIRAESADNQVRFILNLPPSKPIED